MTSQQIHKIAILYQLALYRRFKVAKDLPLIYKLAGKEDSYSLSEFEKHGLSKVWADNKLEADRLGRYWRL